MTEMDWLHASLSKLNVNTYVLCKSISPISLVLFNYLNTVQYCFRAIILAKITYALPAWRGFLTVEQIGRINSFLKRACLPVVLIYGFG